MAASNIDYWQEGQTYVACVYGEYVRGSGFEGIVVTNDGVTWGAERVADLVTVKRSLPGQLHSKRRTNTARMPPEWRLPVEWARRATKGQSGVRLTRAAKLAEATVLPAIVGPGPASYAGFEVYQKRSAHSLAEIHALVDRGLAEALRVWGWDGSGMEVKFHDDERSFGLAYDCGGNSGVRRISLNAKLLESYDADSVYRTIVHEFCHHYREEKWPRRVGGRYYEMHDTKFCEALALIDPTVIGSREKCAEFVDVVDPTLAARAQQRRVELGREPTWTPAAGFILMDRYADGKRRLSWQPRDGFKWPRWARHATVEDILDLAKHFAITEWHRVEVRTDEWRSPYKQPTQLWEMLGYFVYAFPQSTKGLKAFMESAAGVTAT